MSRLAWFNGIKVTASVVVCINTAESFSQSSLPSVQIWLGKEPKLTANVNQARSEQGPREAIWLLRVSSLLSKIFSPVKSSSPPPRPPPRLHRRNLNTQQSPVILDLQSRKARAEKSRDYRDVIVFEKFCCQNISVPIKPQSRRRFQTPPV